MCLQNGSVWHRSAISNTKCCDNRRNGTWLEPSSPRFSGENHLWGLRALKIFSIQDVIFNCWFRQVALRYLFRVRINVILVPFLGNGMCLRWILMPAEWSLQLDQPGQQHSNRVSSPASTNLAFPFPSLVIIKVQRAAEAEAQKETLTGEQL